MDQAQQSMTDKFDDEDYPAYTMGRAAEMLGTTPGFLRSQFRAIMSQYRLVKLFGSVSSTFPQSEWLISVDI